MLALSRKRASQRILDPINVRTGFAIPSSSVGSWLNHRTSSNLPKRLRIFFRFDRRLLAELPRLAWQTVLEVYRGGKRGRESFFEAERKRVAA